MNPTELQPWLQFLSSLVWQAIVVYALFRFRKEIGAAFARGIKKVTVPGAEIEFQEQAADAATPEGVAREGLELIALQDEAGFFTSAGVVKLIEQSGRLAPHDKASDTLLLFETVQQRTWLVATRQKLLCVLDDVKTRASGRLIQWELAFDDAVPIAAHAYKPEVGLIDIGRRKNWLFSLSLFPTPDSVERAVVSFVERAKRLGAEAIGKRAV
jgi:hypothetical protein